MDQSVNAIRDFWDERAGLGEKAATNDFMLTRIEQDFIAFAVPEGSRVLDIGCGNSQSLIRLAKEKGCRGVGVDFSKPMVEVSRKLVAKAQLQDRIENHVYTAPPAPKEYGLFDLVLSNRTLINITDGDLQKQAVQSVPDVLEPNGLFLMVECSVQGGEATNVLREELGLEPIHAPWHNRFFDEAEVKSWQSDSFKIEELLHISSTYHFVSRVIYAKLAEKTGEELIYDSELNKISLLLPQQTGYFGPVKCWKWRKSS